MRWLRCAVLRKKPSNYLKAAPWAMPSTAIIDENTRGLCIAILNGLEVDLDSVLREWDFLLPTMFTVISGG